MCSIKSKHVSACAPFLIEMRYGNLWGWNKMELSETGPEWLTSGSKWNKSGEEKNQNLVMGRHTMLSPQNVFNQRKIKETQLFHFPSLFPPWERTYCMPAVLSKLQVFFLRRLQEFISKLKPHSVSFITLNNKAHNNKEVFNMNTYPWKLVGGCVFPWKTNIIWAVASSSGCE